MKTIVINFDKSLVIPHQDFEIIKDVKNQPIDHCFRANFLEEDLVLMIFNTNQFPIYRIKFQSVIIDGNTLYEINEIRCAVDKEINPEKDLSTASKIVVNEIVTTLNLLDSIILDFVKQKELGTNKNKEIFCYFIRDINNHTYDQLILFDNRTTYLNLYPKLTIFFGILN